MKILVDADACPVKKEITRVAKRHDIGVIFFIDTSHVLEDDYAQVVIVGQGRDAVDFALANRTDPGDIVVTQDYGLAAMVFSKGARAIHPSGLIYTKENMDRLLLERHINTKIRRAGGRHNGPRKRRSEDDLRFEEKLEELLDSQAIIKNGDSTIF
ncbi:MAG TPA: YaiI/YqxD family protein [Bacillota bacterium]|nr:YaiI/YqxD family protein [Bacillota bacterium]